MRQWTRTCSLRVIFPRLWTFSLRLFLQLSSPLSYGVCTSSASVAARVILLVGLECRLGDDALRTHSAHRPRGAESRSLLELGTYVEALDLFPPSAATYRFSFLFSPMANTYK